MEFKKEVFMICIYHNDLDGKCAAAIVKKWNEDRRLKAELGATEGGKPIAFATEIVFIEMDYYRQLDWEKVVKPDEPVIIVDFSLKPDEMNKLLATTKNVIWIDHHATAREYPYQHLDGLRDFQDKHMAGCELAWHYFFPFEAMPKTVQLIGDYDKWALKLAPHCFWFYEGMKLEENDPLSSLWGQLFDPAYQQKRATIMEYGEVAIKYRDSYCEGLCKAFGYETEIDGVKAYACNQFMFGSKGFGERFNQYPLCLAYIHNGEKFTVSLYSETVDVSVIAKNHGGGGHKGAAGFTCEQLPWTVGKC
jgi:oligoribonuclease NrnB/cAMP/cGMP phosphodiesterase (DHH superfamily)